MKITPNSNSVTDELTFNPENNEGSLDLSKEKPRKTRDNHDGFSKPIHND